MKIESIKSVLIPCDEFSTEVVGSFCSYDGQSLAYVKAKADVYVLSEDEIKNLIADAFKWGAWKEQEGHNAIYGEAEMLTEYINSFKI